VIASPGPSAARGGRLASLDVLKGFAALWVLLIHADALPGNPLMVYVFNRAAQIFVVLMGLNAALWWRDRDLGASSTWYRNRFRRLYVPMWCAVAAWWALAAFAPRVSHVPLGPTLLVKHVAGWIVGIGTGWFVTLAIAVALAFPLLVVASRRVGAWPLVALGVASTCACFTYRYELLDRLGMFGWFAFPPRLLAHVTFGMALAPFIRTVGRRAGFAAAAVFAVYLAVPLALGARAPWQLVPRENLAASSATACAQRLMDLPVTVLLLLACRPIARVALFARPLGWLGNESYGIYLGQMITHNAITMYFGFAAVRDAIGAGGYAGVLLAGALAWVALGHAARRALPPLVDAVGARRWSAAATHAFGRGMRNRA